MGHTYQHGEDQARGQFHQIKNEDTGASSTDSQDYTDHTVHFLETPRDSIGKWENYFMVPVFH